MRKNIIQIFEVGTNIATGGSGLRPNSTPIPEVGTGIDTEGNGLRPQKNSRINYPTLYFLVKKYNN